MKKIFLLFLLIFTFSSSAFGWSDNNYTNEEKIIVGNTSGTNSGDEPAASDSVAGVVELAIASEVTTGTATDRAVTPDALAGSDYGKVRLRIPLLDEDTALTTGDGWANIKFPISSEINGWSLVAVHAFVDTVSSSGLPSFAIYNITGAYDILSVNVTIDANEYDSCSATTEETIDTASNHNRANTSDRWRFDCDAAGTGTKGCQIELVFQKP